MPKSATPISLSDDDRSYLKSILQKGTVETRVHRRAKILLLKSDGMADGAIADKLDISRPTVKLCLKKYMESGVKTALEDSKGRGRKAEITDGAKAWVINIACQKPSAHTSKETQEYLNTVPGRFGFVFTPTHGSWLNMMEGFFSKMTRQMLSGIRVNSKEELKERILKYFEDINGVPVPYKWKYRLDTIDLSQEDISTIVYEVVNAKAASPENQGKRAPKPRTRKPKDQAVTNVQIVRLFKLGYTRACLKDHSRHPHAPLCG